MCKYGYMRNIYCPYGDVVVMLTKYLLRWRDSYERLDLSWTSFVCFDPVYVTEPIAFVAFVWQRCVILQQPGLAHVLMTTWALDFESRDYRFLAHESGILPTLQAMVTLTNTADMANSALARLSDAPPEQKENHIEREASAKAAQRWTPWSLENIREGFIQVNRWTGAVHTWLFRWIRNGDGHGNGDSGATDLDDDRRNMQSVLCSAMQCSAV